MCEQDRVNAGGEGITTQGGEADEGQDDRVEGKDGELRLHGQ